VELIVRSLSQRKLTRRHAVQGVLAIGGLALAGCSAAGGESSDASGELLAWPAEDRWPDLFMKAPASVQEAYRYAVANEHLLQWMPCFCGCGDFGHVSNFDCYVQEMRDDGSVLLDSMSFG
jgi:hypothetical protein